MKDSQKDSRKRTGVGVFKNPRAELCAWDDAAEAVLPGIGFEQAAREIESWDEYVATPLLDLPRLARELGLGALWYKDEGERFATSAFKVLGGAYAVQRAAAETERRITVTSATDGNHGRAVAWGARRFGCDCVIYLHLGVSAGREQAIEELGASIVREGATYDESVEACRRDAELHQRVIIADTSWPGYEEVPRAILQGYRIMVEEVVRELDNPTFGDELPTHVIVQAGVGGLAASVLGHLWWRFGTARPTCVVVEPLSAACCFASAQAGRPHDVEGDLETLMAGLSCGEVSPLAWRLVERAADLFTTLPEDFVVPAMRRLAQPSSGEKDGADPRVVVGESGAAGVGLLMAAAVDDPLREALGLDSASRVLVFGTEGATDRDLWQRLTGFALDPG